MSDIREVLERGFRSFHPREPDIERILNRVRGRRRRHRVEAAIVALVVGATGAALAALAFSGVRETSPAGSNNGPLIFTKVVANPKNAVEDSDIFALQADGSGPRRLTMDAGADERVAVSPDGSSIAFVRETDVRTSPSSFQAHSAIYVLRLSGGRPRLIHPCVAGLCGPPSWSPDSKHIAFADDGRVQVIDADGSRLRTLCGMSCGQGLAEPAWSPDGTMIAFSQRGLLLGIGPCCDPSAIWVVNADGTGAHKLTNANCTASTLQDCSVDTGPAWSPDGSEIAFGRFSIGRDVPGQPRVESEPGSVYVMRTDGSKPRRLWRCPNPYCQAISPSWSPAGSSIAFSGDPIHPVVDVVTSRGQLTGEISLCPGEECAFVGAPIWSPDGLEIAFTATRKKTTLGLYVAQPDGSGLHRILTGRIESVVWAPQAR
jgi:Tol biopolymer transport system component